jgi:hypothetical protein
MIKIFEIAANDLVIDWKRATALALVFLIFQIIVEFIRNVLFNKTKNNHSEGLEKNKIKNHKYIDAFGESYSALRRLEMKSIPSEESDKILFKSLLRESRNIIEDNYLHIKDDDYQLMCEILDKLTKKSISRGFVTYDLKKDMKKLKESYRVKC